MASKNKKEATVPLTTHEGGIAVRINEEQQLRRSVLSCMLWENAYYEDGKEIADRIAGLVGKVNPKVVYDLAIEAREEMKLRHVPLFLECKMLKNPEQKK
jgi:hypothetical protein